MVDVLTLVLRKTEQEHASLRRSISDHGAVSARATASRARDTLFYQAAAKVGIDQTAFRPRDSVTQPFVYETFLAGEPRENLRYVLFATRLPLRVWKVCLSGL